MKLKVDKRKSIKTKLKLVLKAKSNKKKVPVHVSNERNQEGNEKASKQTPQKSQNKLSTLDQWLRTLYQPNSRRNKIFPMDTDTGKIETQGTSKENKLELSKTLFVRLEKLDLLELKQRSNHCTAMKGNKNQTKKRSKLHKLLHKDRALMYIRLEDNTYKCVKCDYIHRNIVSMKTHFDKEHSDKIYKCSLCEFQTPQQYYFNTHMKYHSKPDLECPHCKKMIKAFSYKMHVKTHERNDKTEYKCKVCEYRSYNHANVKRHTLALHKNPHELQTFSCDSCNYVTILAERLKLHKKTVHSKEGTWLTCSHCDYTTRNKAHLIRHEKGLHNQKEVECPECSQLFSTKDNLRYHMQRRHSDLSSRKFYYCEMCPKEEQYKTSEKGNLARHILAHRTIDEIEVFACHKCPYLGKSKHALKTHFINAHLPELHNYKCKICGYSTSTKSRYTYHIKDVHGEPNPSKSIGRKNNNSTSVVTTTEGDDDIKEENDELDELSDVAEDVDDTDTYVTAKQRSQEIDNLFDSIKELDVTVTEKQSVEEVDSRETGDDVDTSVTKKQIKLTDLWAKQDNQQG